MFSFRMSVVDIQYKPKLECVDILVKLPRIKFYEKLPINCKVWMWGADRHTT
jgi:hypothetical protein